MILRILSANGFGLIKSFIELTAPFYSAIWGFVPKRSEQAGHTKLQADEDLVPVIGPVARPVFRSGISVRSCMEEV